MNRTPPATDTLIAARGVTRTYKLEGETVHPLRGVDLDVRRGEYLSIMGPSGSGKSTLFNMIGGLDRPSSGTILLDGEDLASLPERKLAWLRCHRIGYIFQTYNLMPTLTAVDNVGLPAVFAGLDPEAAHSRAAEALSRVGLADRLDNRPDQLSGGQRQRVAIARAIVNRPAVILADEPTGNLDLKTGQQVLDLLKQLRRDTGVTVISATHDHKMLAASDRVVWIRDGRIDQIKTRDEIDIAVGTLEGHAT